MTFPLLRSLTFLAVAACSALAAHAADLTLSVAASLTNAFKDIAPLFEASNPGTKLQLNFGASGALLQQIAKGAPVDVFVSADQETMDQAQKDGLVKADKRRDFVSNTLVVIVPAMGSASGAAAAAPKAMADLAQASFKRIAIGLPASVPVGRYTKSVLEAANLWGAIEPKMVGANNVRQALDYVARGEVDAGLVYATDAALMADKVKVAFTVPTTKPVLYSIATLTQAPNAAAAAKFVEFVFTAPAQAILARYGFGKP
ncbi:MAG: molybdate ABC transporter substrate-binding protein [Rubrivivax sp.]